MKWVNDVRKMVLIGLLNTGLPQILNLLKKKKKKKNQYLQSPIKRNEINEVYLYNIFCLSIYHLIKFDFHLFGYYE